ncbi:unnamed protein product [Danaus chrysippus]|uniref:(African queen) hypothetical protein n=1 Tax=Danaus chrysippus TaxID=151541 RepID=A0A8J2QM58_9NEOP|nr:unnamed protein product [Danaus chrysippus]
MHAVVSNDHCGLSSDAELRDMGQTEDFARRSPEQPLPPPIQPCSGFLGNVSPVEERIADVMANGTMGTCFSNPFHVINNEAMGINSDIIAPTGPL